MHILVRTVFSKLHELEPKAEEAKLQAGTIAEEAEGELRMTVTTKEVTNEDAGSVNADDSTVKSDSIDQKVDDAPPLSPVNRPECMYFSLRSSLLLTS